MAKIFRLTKSEMVAALKRGQNYTFEHGLWRLGYRSAEQVRAEVAQIVAFIAKCKAVRARKKAWKKSAPARRREQKVAADARRHALEEAKK